MNTNIDPILYECFLLLRKKCGATIVHRRRRKSSTRLEIVFRCKGIEYISGRLNTLKNAEHCGFWIICRPQRKGRHAVWKGLPVYQLFLTPVHPKKRHEAQLAAERQAIHAQQAAQVTFEPVEEAPAKRKRRTPIHPQKRQKYKNSNDFCQKICVFEKNVVILQPILRI